MKVSNSKIQKFPQGAANFIFIFVPILFFAIEFALTNKIAPTLNQQPAIDSSAKIKLNSNETILTPKRNPSRGNNHGQTRRKLTKSNPMGPSKPLPASSSEPLELAQSQARLMAQYNNTPPLFSTHTRDFFIDVARHSLGSKLVSMQAIDVDGDPLEYSLRPALLRDASGHFAINSTSGELRLAHKPFKYYLPPAGSLNSSDSSSRAEVGDEQISEEEAAAPEDEEGANRGELDEEVEGLNRNLYFLNVAADDGHYTTVVELQIHIINSSSIAAIQSLNSVHLLTNSANGIYNIIKHKTEDYFDKLTGADKRQATSEGAAGSSNSSSTIYPNFVNPSLVKPTDETETEVVENSNEPLIAKASETSQNEAQQQRQNSQRSNLPEAIAKQLQGKQTSANRQALDQVNDNGSELQLLQQRLPKLQDSLPQPMIVGLVVVCSSLIVVLVILVFVIPISVKKLRKRLDNVEMQHEHLSQKTSNASCSFLGSSAASTTSGGANINSSLSQFTLGSEVSCIIRAANASKRAPLGGGSICRQSSLDSALTASGCAMAQASHHGPQTRLEQQQHHPVLTNSVYLNHLNHLNRPPTITDNFHVQSSNQHDRLLRNYLERRLGGPEVGPSESVDSQVADLRRQQLRFVQQLSQQADLDNSILNSHEINNNIYCPIDGDEFYSSISPNHMGDLSSTFDKALGGNAGFSISNSNKAQRSPHLELFARGNTAQDEQKQRGNVSNFACDYNFATAENYDDLALPAQLETSANSAIIPDNLSTHSGSSTKSLARFLSLPNRHPNGLTSTNADDSDVLQQASSTVRPEAGKLVTNFEAKTIARTSRVSREQYDSREWEIERHRLESFRLLGKGQFGIVWHCKLKVGLHEYREVAVKTMLIGNSKNEREREELLAEIEIMKLVCEHPNVVKILHCCTFDCRLSIEKPIYLIMEYVKLGNLHSYLEKFRLERNYTTTNASEDNFLKTDSSSQTNSCAGSVVPAITSKDLIKYIYHVAKGMEYISSNCIVHRDLASRNILISEDLVCKIGDFGMARHISSLSSVYERHLNNTRIPVRWMAPEVLLNNKFTIKSDVYSFGILMWEIITLGSTPYTYLKTEQIIDEVARKGQRPEKPKYCHDVIYKLMSKCWLNSPNDRPTFKQLVVELEELFSSSNDYIKLDQYPDHSYYNVPPPSAYLLS